MSAKTASIAFTTTLTVDLDAWALTYGMTPEEALEDAKTYLSTCIVEGLCPKVDEGLISMVRTTRQTEPQAVTPTDPRSLWSPSVNGHSARPWFLTRVNAYAETEYHNSKALNLVRYADFVSAKRAADRLNKRG